jgi:hypothetical protein
LTNKRHPKGTDLSRHGPEELAAVAALNSQPRKTLGWKTPAEALDEQLLSVPKPVLRRPIEPGLPSDLEDHHNDEGEDMPS